MKFLYEILKSGPVCTESHKIIGPVFFEEMASDGCSDLIVMSSFRESTERKKCRTVPFLCENIFGEKLLILQDKLCNFSRNISR